MGTYSNNPRQSTHMPRLAIPYILVLDNEHRNSVILQFRRAVMERASSITGWQVAITGIQRPREDAPRMKDCSLDGRGSAQPTAGSV